MAKVKFKAEKTRQRFFYSLKEEFGNWYKIADYIKVNRYTIIRYKNGMHLMDLETFNKLNNFVKLKNFNNKIEFLDDNWGSKLGGELTYKNHKWIFDSGRKKLMMRHRQTDNKVLNLDLNSTELAEFIGILIGDGFIGKYGNHRMLQITGHKVNDRAYYLGYLAPLIEKLFKIKPKFYDRETCIRLTIYSKIIFNTINKLFQFPIGIKNDIAIPGVLLRTKESKIAVIRGIFDTDGCIFISKKKNVTITLTTTSKPLAKQIYEILGELGFEVYQYTHMNKKGKKLAYRAILNGKHKVLKWKDLIGSSNPSRIKKINATVAQII